MARPVRGPVVTLEAVPAGRGRWSPVRFTVAGKHAAAFGGMLGFKAGQRFELGGIKWRVVAVNEE